MPPKKARHKKKKTKNKSRKLKPKTGEPLSSSESEIESSELPVVSAESSGGVDNISNEEDLEKESDPSVLVHSGESSSGGGSVMESKHAVHEEDDNYGAAADTENEIGEANTPTDNENASDGDARVSPDCTSLKVVTEMNEEELLTEARKKRRKKKKKKTANSEEGNFTLPCEKNNSLEITDNVGETRTTEDLAKESDPSVLVHSGESSSGGGSVMESKHAVHEKDDNYGATADSENDICEANTPTDIENASDGDARVSPDCTSLKVVAEMNEEELVTEVRKKSKKKKKKKKKTGSSEEGNFTLPCEKNNSLEITDNVGETRTTEDLAKESKPSVLVHTGESSSGGRSVMESKHVPHKKDDTNFAAADTGNEIEANTPTGNGNASDEARKKRRKKKKKKKKTGSSEEGNFTLPCEKNNSLEITDNVGETRTTEDLEKESDPSVLVHSGESSSREGSVMESKHVVHEKDDNYGAAADTENEIGEANTPTDNENASDEKEKSEELVDVLEEQLSDASSCEEEDQKKERRETASDREDYNHGVSTDEHTGETSCLVDEVNTFEDVCSEALNSCRDNEEPLEETERKNFLCLFRLLVGVGADVLRKYFRSIHPNWSDSPIDARNLDRGILNLNTNEEQMFNTGNTEKWDVALLISVLRFSKCSSIELEKKPHLKQALLEIRDIRNMVIAHASSERLETSGFQRNWKLLKSNLILLGAREDEIDSTLLDYSSLIAEQYRSILLDEIHRLRFLGQELKKIDEPKGGENEVLPPKLGSPSWNTWQTFLGRVNHFNSSLSHFVLLVDVMPEEDLQNYKVLSAIPWKMILDFNPSSEDDGFYKLYQSQGTLQLLVSPWTPGQIKNATSNQLPKQIEKQRTQWLFVNGRQQDRDDWQPKDFPGWENSSKKQISRFFSCCSDDDKFDHQKSITCVLLPISRRSLPYVDVTLQRLQENFEEFSIEFFCFERSSYREVDFIQEKLNEFPLTSLQVKQCIEFTFYLSDGAPNYQMPTSQAGVFLRLSAKTYVYHSEHLQLFYEGCESEFIDLKCDEDERDKVEEEHRRSFMSGNLISPVSLYFNHDAKRLIENDIQVHIERMLCQPLKHSVIVEIMHSPGTGGSTIARRVLWALHRSFPCVVVKMPVQFDFDELDASFIRKVCERIASLEDECGMPVLVLVDDLHHCRNLGATNRIVRTLNAAGKKSVILECLHVHNSETEKQQNFQQNIHKVFFVGSRLEDTPADLKEFRSKYKEYMSSESGARRVFHFPLLSMVEEFRPKLENIVFSTLDELDTLERNVAALVAFFQLYAGQSTPALLIYESFKCQFEIKNVQSVTYDNIKDQFTDKLLNLMIHQNPRNRMNSPSECLERYTLQHIDVAKLVFKKHLENTKQTLFLFVDAFLDTEVVRSDKFLSLFCDLLLYHKSGNRELRFSLLFDTLGNQNERKAAELFCKAAANVADPRIYGNAARFCAKMNKPNFTKAKDLIMKGLEICKTKGRFQSIQDSKGVVLCIELKNQIKKRKIKTIDHLQLLAESAINAFKEARDFPPTFHPPLIGEVEVWLLCIEWIIKNCCEGDEEKAIKFLASSAPPFFRTCVGDCYTLLDRVDEIIRSSTTISDPEKAQEHSQRVRWTLVTVTRPKGNKFQTPRRVVEDICDILVSGRKLPPNSEKQIKRYKAWTLLSLSRDQQIEKPGDLLDLVKLLEEMVFIEKEHSFARHLLRICPQIIGPRSYDLERAMKISNFWAEAEEYDPMPYFYCMVIAFMQIVNGHGPAGYYGIYQEMLGKLREKSRFHCRRTDATHFLGKSTDGMSQLVSRAILFAGQDYRADNSEAVTSFWTVECRQKLKECVGRIRVKVEGKSELTIVELLQGGVQLRVKKNHGIGKPGKDFDTDAKVYFVVSFNLGGPVANGITFEPYNEHRE